MYLQFDTFQLDEREIPDKEVTYTNKKGKRVTVPLVNKFALIVVDAFGKFVWVRLLQTPKGAGVAAAWDGLKTNPDVIGIAKALDSVFSEIKRDFFYDVSGQMGCPVHDGAAERFGATDPAVQVWSSMYDNSIPCALHGGDIASIEFYIRDQDSNFVELQSTAFQATVRLTWDDPAPPRIGSAGADAEEAYGLRDVTYGYRR